MKLAIVFLLKISLLSSFAARAEEELITFDEVITAKRSLLLQNSYSEQKIGEDQFQVQKPQTLENILKQMPSLSVSDPFNGTSGVFFRGADSEKLLVLVDGIVMNDPTAPSGGFDFRTLQPSEIEEVRLWSPGESVVWGPGALGGILSIKTKRKVGNSLQASLACLKTYQAGLVTSFERENWMTLFSLSGKQSEGQSTVAPSFGGNELDGQQRLNVRLSTSRQSDSSLQRISAFYSQGTDQVDKSSPLADDPNATSTVQTSTLNFQDERSTNESNEIFSSISIKKIARVFSDPPDALNVSNQNYQYDSYGYLARMQYLQVLNAQLKLDTGFDYDGTYAFFNEGVPFSQQNNEVGTFLRFHQKSSLGKLIPGIRLQYNTLGQWNALTSMRYEYSFETGTQIEYHAASGIKQPTLYQRYSSVGNSSLNSEKVEYHHIGVGREMPTQKWMVLFFQEWYRDLIQFVTKYENVASANVKGFEFQYSKDFGRVKVNFSGSEILTVDGQGLNLLRRPRQQLSLSTDHFLGKIRLAPLFIWKGAREDSYSGSRVFLPSYLQFDFGLHYFYQSDLHFQLALRNLLGQDMTEAYGYQALGRRAELGLQYFW